MNDENVILAYKLKENEVKILEKLSNKIDKSIVVKSTDVPQDIVAMPAFLVLANLKDEPTEEHKNKVLECIAFSRDTVECLVINENTFTKLDDLEHIISMNYKKYNEPKAVDRVLDSEWKLQEKISMYQKAHSLNENDLSFSEIDLLNYFDNCKLETKMCITNYIYHEILFNSKILEYVDISERKISPLGYLTLKHGILSSFMNLELLDSPIYYGENKLKESQRRIQVSQLQKLCDILAEEIYIDKYDKTNEYGNLNEKIANNTITVSDEHLIAFRLSSFYIFPKFMRYIGEIIKNYLLKTKINYDDLFTNKFDAELWREIIEEKASIDYTDLFTNKFDDELWREIRLFIRNFASLPLWNSRDKDFTKNVFCNFDVATSWKKNLETGVTENGIQVLEEPIDVTKMINDNYLKGV